MSDTDGRTLYYDGLPVPNHPRVELVTTRLISRVAEPGPAIREPEDIGKLLCELIGNRDRELTVAVHLDGSHKVVSVDVISVGTINSAIVHPREVFKGAILANARAIIFGHNHPSGELDPSPEDIAITKHLEDAGTLLGIPLLDSLIVNSRTYRQVDPTLPERAEDLHRRLRQAPTESASPEPSHNASEFFGFNHPLASALETLLIYLVDQASTAEKSADPHESTYRAPREALSRLLDTLEANKQPAAIETSQGCNWIQALEGALRRFHEADPLAQIDCALSAARLLVSAYDRGEENSGSIEWEDLDLAHEQARAALGDPLSEIETSQEEETDRTV